MAKAVERSEPKISDPLFLIMLVALVLAIGCSLMLRAVVSSPRSATAAAMGNEMGDVVGQTR